MVKASEDIIISKVRKEPTEWGTKNTLELEYAYLLI